MFAQNVEMLVLKPGYFNWIIKALKLWVAGFGNMSIPTKSIYLFKLLQKGFDLDLR